MRRSVIAALLTGTALAVVPAAAAAGATGVPQAAQAAHVPAGPAVLIHPGVVHSLGNFRQPPTTADCESAFQVACYEPGQIQKAYGTPALYRRGITGKGQTIIIVDSFGSPTIASDLATFDSTFGLPAPPSFKILQPAGPVPPFDPTNGDMVGWAFETSLDVEYAHTIAPGASIVLLETPVSETEGTTGFPQIVTAEKYAIRHHLGGVISQSFSATEQTFATKSQIEHLRGAYLAAYRHHVTVLSAAGDSGAANVGLDGETFYTYPTTTWPPSDPLVTGIGGTQLHLNANGSRTSPDTVWNDTYSVPTNQFIVGDNGPNALAGGGGLSVWFRRPSYQDSVRRVVGKARGVPDISMSAACNGAVDVYLSFPGVPAGWFPTCGTSEATPLFAGIVSLADQVAHHPLGLINPTLYRLSREHAPGLVDVTSGNNTVTFPQDNQNITVKGYSAGRGYDLASGVGTVWAPAFVYELAGAGHRHRHRHW
ncbi:MAG TPA: S53 family peptidase [Streptosporangiaceae bacterium]|nr:S53 family peptidase [Streptosporangiaceae bacterium]